MKERRGRNNLSYARVSVSISASVSVSVSISRACLLACLLACFLLFLFTMKLKDGYYPSLSFIVNKKE